MSFLTSSLPCYAELQGKSLEFVNQVSYMIWSGEVEHWPAHVKETVRTEDGYESVTTVMRPDGSVVTYEREVSR